MTNIKQVGGNHYDRFPYPLGQFLVDFGALWCEGEILVYVCRAPFKNGVQDIDKAISLLPWLAAEMEHNGRFSYRLPPKMGDIKRRFFEENKKALSPKVQEFCRGLLDGEALCDLKKMLEAIRNETAAKEE